MRSTNKSNAAYWLVGFALGLMAMGGNIPSPLYAIYQREWGFSEAVLTLIFAAYALALIPTLLILGNLSDQVGRRRMVILGLLMISIGSLLFSLAQGVAWLFAARIVQGVAVGIISGAATAALAELNPREDRQAAALVATAALAGGTAIGPLFGGLMAQYAPEPLVLTYVAHLGITVLVTLGILALMPETVEVREREAWRPRRPRVPIDIRYPFALGSTACFCGWAAGGLFLALVPSYVSSLLQVNNPVVGGGTSFVMFGCAAVVQVFLRKLPSDRAIALGTVALFAGLASIVAAVPLHFLWLLLAGSILNGAGLGLGFMGGVGLVSRVAPPESRAEVLSACYVVSYLGFGLPVVGVGLASGSVGLFAAVTGFAVVVGFVCLLVALSVLSRPPRIRA